MREFGLFNPPSSGTRTKEGAPLELFWVPSEVFSAIFIVSFEPSEGVVLLADIGKVPSSDTPALTGLQNINIDQISCS